MCGSFKVNKSSVLLSFWISVGWQLEDFYRRGAVAGYSQVYSVGSHIEKDRKQEERHKVRWEIDRRQRLLMGKLSSSSSTAITITLFSHDSSFPLFSSRPTLCRGFVTSFRGLIKRCGDTWLGYSACLQSCMVRTPPFSNNKGDFTLTN